MAWVDKLQLEGRTAALGEKFNVDAMPFAVGPEHSSRANLRRVVRDQGDTRQEAENAC